MNQKIFELKLSINATSLYLLMASLLDAGADLTCEIVTSLWNGEPNHLDEAKEELARCKIAALDNNGPWRILPATAWESA